MSLRLEFPARPRLLPGVLVTRRGEDQLQIGLDPDLAVVTADLPETRAVLAALREGCAPVLGPDTPLVALRLCADLLARHLVVDGDALVADLRVSVEEARAVAAVYARAGLAATDHLVRRRARPVRVMAPEPFDAQATRLLELAGVPTGVPVDRPPYAALVIAFGEVSRDVVDQLAQDGTPHLVVRLGERAIEVGPFVVPGVTACLRCVDAHLSDEDPRRGLVVQQYADAPSRRSDGVPHPVDAALATMVIGAAVRDLVGYVDDERPVTWSTTVRLGPGGRERRTPWRRHPHCGCAWGVAATG